MKNYRRNNQDKIICMKDIEEESDYDYKSYWRTGGFIRLTYWADCKLNNKGKGLQEHKSKSSFDLLDKWTYEKIK